MKIYKAKDSRIEEMKKIIEYIYSAEGLKKMLPEINLPFNFITFCKDYNFGRMEDWGIELDMKEGNIELNYWKGKIRKAGTEYKLKKEYCKKTSGELVQKLIKKGYTAENLEWNAFEAINGVEKDYYFSLLVKSI